VADYSPGACGDGLEEGSAPAVADHGVRLAERAGHRSRGRVAGEESRDLGAVPGKDRVDRTRPEQHARGLRGRQQPDAVTVPAERRDRRPQQDQVAERARADDEDVQDGL
jgi:hypothetical protein